MSRKERYALLAALMRRLREKGSWCGETHVQKGAFLAQELMQVPFGYNFRLYKHGPYSFELRDELASMHADDALKLRAQSYPYGPTLEPTKRGEQLIEQFVGLIGDYRDKLDFVAAEIGSNDVKCLERVATGLLISSKMKGVDEYQRAQRLHELKPHIPMPAAIDAIRQVDRLVADSEGIRAA